ncbi:MAG: DUF2945 domain-containing protein [Pseudomonadota bacterium]
MAGYEKGTEVEWDWGKGTAVGEIDAVYTQKRTLHIAGTQVTREASEDCPAYKIKQKDGQTVLKSHSEVRRSQ